MIVLGIDPGLKGGLAIVEKRDGEVPNCLYAGDIPVTGLAAKRRVDARGVIQLIQKYHPNHAFIERAQSMPDQGASSGFHYGRAVGALEACVTGMMVPLEVIETTAWKKTNGLMKREKEDSRQRALMLFPTCPFFGRKMDHNRAEAVLIALHGLNRLRFD